MVPSVTCDSAWYMALGASTTLQALYARIASLSEVVSPGVPSLRVLDPGSLVLSHPRKREMSHHRQPAIGTVDGPIRARTDPQELFLIPNLRLRLLPRFCHTYMLPPLPVFFRCSARFSLPFGADRILSPQCHYPRHGSRTVLWGSRSFMELFFLHTYISSEHSCHDQIRDVGRLGFRWRHILARMRLHRSAHQARATAGPGVVVPQEVRAYKSGYPVLPIVPPRCRRLLPIHLWVRFASLPASYLLFLRASPSAGNDQSRPVHAKKAAQRI